MKSEQQQHAYFPHIDGLRALAVLGVIGFHAFPNWIRGGFIGVDIFFVISGFLITNIILKSIHNKTFSIVDFYARRIRRIFPCLLLVLISSLCVGWYIFLPDEFGQLLKHVAGGSSFLSNLILWKEMGYFDVRASDKPLLHLWSLAVEEQFYIFWPVLLLLLTRIRTPRAVMRAILSVIFISFILNILLVPIDHSLAFYAPFTRFWELAAGGLLTQVKIIECPSQTKRANIAGLIGLMIIGFSLFFLKEGNTFPGWWAALPVMGAMFVIYAGENSLSNKIVLGNRIAVSIGLISYPLYLWHWSLLVFAKIGQEHLLSVSERIGLIALTFVLSILTYIFVEKPIRKSASFKVAVFLLGCVVCVFLFSAYGFWKKIPPRNDSEEIRAHIAAAYDWDFPAATAQKISVPDLVAFQYNSHSDKKVIYIGDSNLEQYAPRIAKVIHDAPDDYHTAIVVGNQRLCNVTSEIFQEGACAAALVAVKERIKQDDIVGVVIVGSGSNYNDHVFTKEKRENMMRFIADVSAQDKAVYLVANMPSGENADPKNMFSGTRLTHITIKDRADIKFNMVDFMQKYGDMRDQLQIIAAQSHAVLIDPLLYLCPQGICPLLDEIGEPLYKDSNHMRPFYAARDAVYVDIPIAIKRNF